MIEQASLRSIKDLNSPILNSFQSDNTKNLNTSNVSTKTTASLSQGNQDGLVTFTISVGQPEPKSSNHTLGRWIERGEEISIKSYTTTKGFFYLGGKLEAYKTDAYYNMHETEASLVDETLAFEKKEKYYTDDTLNYWPKFIELSPKARGAYLDWLFGDRSDSETPIGYVFIYFYGLERRVLIDGSNGKVIDREFSELFEEIKRLREVFVDNYAFQNYSTKLIELMVYLRPQVVSMNCDEFSTRYDSLLFRYQLAKTVQDGQPINADLALNWIKFSDQYNLRTPARRCENEFSILFKIFYQKETKDGLIVKPNKTKLHLGYYPASSTLRGFNIAELDLPDPSVLKAPVKKLILIADHCTNALEAYSRYLGRKGTSKTDFEAVILLPEVLRSSHAENLLTSFKEWAEDKIIKNNGLVLFSDLWAFTGKPNPDKFNKKEQELLSDFLTLGNYFCVPDPLIHNIKPQVDGYVVISHDGLGNNEKTTDSFKKALLYIRLGVMLSKSDSTIHEKETDLLSKVIDEDSALSTSEKESLNSYFLWSLSSHVNNTGLKQQLENISESSKAYFRRALIQVVLADGKIETSEIKQLEKLYTMLGIDKGLISSDLHQYTAEKTFKTQSINISDNSFVLDATVLAQHEAETKEVHALLGSIFIEDELLEEKVESPPLKLEHLDSKHVKLFETLISKEKWQREEVVALCQKNDLMVDGAIETINDWAYDMIDAPVLEDDGDIYVDQEIVEELKGV